MRMRLFFLGLILAQAVNAGSTCEVREKYKNARTFTPADVIAYRAINCDYYAADTCEKTDENFVGAIIFGKKKEGMLSYFENHGRLGGSRFYFAGFSGSDESFFSYISGANPTEQVSISHKLNLRLSANNQILMEGTLATEYVERFEGRLEETRPSITYPNENVRAIGYGVCWYEQE